MGPQSSCEARIRATRSCVGFRVGRLRLVREEIAIGLVQDVSPFNHLQDVCDIQMSQA